MTMTGRVTQQASTYMVDIAVPKDELITMFDKYWNEVKDVLPAHLIKLAQKGGYRKITRDRVVKGAGGPAQFYSPVLMNVVEEYLNTQERQALSFNSVDMENDEVSGTITINSSVFLEPEITWKKKPGIDEPLTIKVLKDPPNYLEMLVDDELKKKQGKSVVLEPLPVGTKVEYGHVVVLDATSAIIKDDGTFERWAPGCLSMNKWLVDKATLKTPELAEALVGTIADDVRTIDIVLNDKFDTDVGKKVRVVLKTLQVYNRVVPAIDDDLAKTNGYDSLVIWTQALTTGNKKKILEGKDAQKRHLVLSTIVNPEVVSVGPLPIEWLRRKGQEVYMEARARVKTEEELVTHFVGKECMNGTPVTNKQTITQFFAEKSAQQLVNDLVVRSWGVLKGVAGDRTLTAMTQYVEAVMGELLQTVVVEEGTEIPT